MNRRWHRRQAEYALHLASEADDQLAALVKKGASIDDPRMRMAITSLSFVVARAQVHATLSGR